MLRSKEAVEFLITHRFAVVPGAADDISDIYTDAEEDGDAVFVTTDVVLHTAHLFFDSLLRVLEKTHLSAVLESFTDRMIVLSAAQYEAAGETAVKEAARLNIGYFCVAKKLLDPNYPIGFGLDNYVSAEISRVDAHDGLHERALLPYVEDPSLTITPYAYEDYSQYIPRGHYAGSKSSRRYFTAMMWYGRMGFAVNPGVAEKAVPHGRMMTLQALLMTDALAGDDGAHAAWKTLFETTSYFVGPPDDLTVDDYRTLAAEIFPDPASIDDFGDVSRLDVFRERVKALPPPRIISSAATADGEDAFEAARGFHLLGQRFTQDAYIFQNLVFGPADFTYTGKGKPFTLEVIPAIGPVRAFPRGLDVLAALGSDRALEILQDEGDADYTGYRERLDALRDEFSNEDYEDAPRTLSRQWLHALIPLLEEPPKGVRPACMETDAWRDKELITALGSWAELRHDTILSAKQSYTMIPKALPPSAPDLGYVEPYPEVYGRLARMMEDMERIIPPGLEESEIAEKLERFRSLLTELEETARKELSGAALTDDDYDTIRTIGKTLKYLTTLSTGEEPGAEDDAGMAVIADVHTEPNTGQVLEVGVGRLLEIYVHVDDENGKRLCRGGMFSYYEFKRPMNKRLTDEQWREMVGADKLPELAPWIERLVCS